MEKTKEWYIVIGKKLIDEGLMPRSGMRVIWTPTREVASLSLDGSYPDWSPDNWSNYVPDCRQRITRKMIEMHIEDVAREVYGDRFGDIDFNTRGDIAVCDNLYTTKLLLVSDRHPESYLNALRKMRAEKKGPYDLKTNPGDRFTVPANHLITSLPSNPLAAGLIIKGSGIRILLEARKVREDDIWECYPVIPVPDGFTDVGLKDSWMARLLTDSEVQRYMISNKIEEADRKL